MKNWLQNTYSQALLIGLFFLLLFIVFISRDYMAVDGTTRCIEVSYRNEIFFHDNNHMLFPTNVFFWHKLLIFLGITASDRIQYIHLTTAMNSLAASIVLALYFLLIKLLTNSTKYALVITACYGFSRAFLLHATNASEPMVGLLWSVLAITLLAIGLKKGYPKVAFLAGCLFALAMGTYQSMVLIGSLGLVLCLGLSDNEQPLTLKDRLLRLFYLFSGSAFGVAAVYGSAYYYSGTRSLPLMIQRLVSVKGNNVYGSLSLWKFLTLPVQFLRNVFPIMPGDFSGIVGWAVENLNDHWQYWAFLIYGLVLFLILVIVLNWRKIKEAPIDEKIAVQAALAGAFTTLLAAGYWFPGYDKLWLQPNFCLIFAFGILIKNCFDSKYSVLNKLTIPIISIILLLEISSNFFWLTPSRFQENKALIAAQEVSQIVKSPPDLVIDDWDFVSLLYGALWSHHIYSFPSGAEQKGIAVLDDVKKLIEETKERGGKVYFIGVLDETEGTWSWFLGPRGVPFHSLDEYRKKAKMVKHFKFSAFSSSLWLLDFDSENKETASSAVKEKEIK